MANIFGTTEEEEDNLLRLYNPQEYYLQNPYLPPVAQPIAPTPDPIILGGNQDNSGNPNADPFGTMNGTYQPNPNILGQYVGLIRHMIRHLDTLALPLITLMAHKVV